MLQYLDRGDNRHCPDLECDLSSDHGLCVFNSRLLAAYRALDPRVTGLLCVVKAWAKHHELNDASQGTFTSYSLAIMTVRCANAFPPTPPSPFVCPCGICCGISASANLPEYTQLMLPLPAAAVTPASNIGPLPANDEGPAVPADAGGPAVAEASWMVPANPCQILAAQPR